MWNIVEIDNKCYIVDVRNSSTELIDPKDPTISKFFKSFQRLGKDVGHIGVTVMN